MVTLRGLRLPLTACMIWGDFMHTPSMYSLCEDVDEPGMPEPKPSSAARDEGRKAPGELPCSRWSSAVGNCNPSPAHRGRHTGARLAFCLPLTACPSRVPEHCMGVGWGWPRTQEVPSGGLWARPELASALGGKDIPRSLRNLHSPLLLLPPLYPQLQRRRALAGGGGEAAESALCCLPGLWRAEQAMALASQPPPLAGITYLHPFPSVLPPHPHGPVPLSEWAGHRGVGARQGLVCHLATPAWPRALSREGFGFPDRDQVSQREKKERKTKKRKKRSDLLQLEPS